MARATTATTAYRWDRLKMAVKELTGVAAARQGNWLTGHMTVGAAFHALLPAAVLGRPGREITEELLRETERVIDRWDVRKAGRLIALFPEIVAVRHRDKLCRCELDGQGEWVVVFHGQGSGRERTGL